MARIFNHEALLRARLELDLSQEQLATALGIDVRTLRRYESGSVNEGREGFSVRQPARRKLIERMCEELGLTEADLLVEPSAAPPPPPEAPPEAPSPSPAVPRLPLHVHTLQRARHFVGRDEVLARLSAWAEAQRPDAGVIALVGVGGAGKSAVAERFVTGLGDGARRGGVFVWSFYDDTRTEVFLAHAVRYFAGAEVPPGERIDRLQEALRGGAPHLMVLDGLETVQAEGGGGRAHGEIEDPLLRRLLCALARGLGGARALVTTRFELADLAPWAGAGADTIRLTALSDAEAARLLRQWGVLGDDAALGRLGAGTGGHALSIAVMGSYVGAFLGGDPAPLDGASLAEAARDDRLARRLAGVLAAYARALPEGERDLMARLSVLSAGADEEALAALARAGSVAGAMAGWGIAEIRRGLTRLDRLGLVFRAGVEPPRWSAHPFVREHFKTLLGVAPSAVEAALAPPQISLTRAPRRPPREGEALDALEALARALIAAGRMEEAYGVYARSMGGFSHLGLVLGEMSRGARAVRAFASADDPLRYSDALPLLMRAALAYDAGLYAGALGDLELAVRCYATHNALAEEADEPVDILIGLRTMAYTRRLRGQIRLALELVEQSIDIAVRVEYPGHIERGSALRASILHDLGEVDAATDVFAHLRASDDGMRARRGLWEAEHLLAVGRKREAVEMTRANIEDCAYRGWAGHVAHGHALLGLSAACDDPADAEAHLVEVRRWASASGEVEMALRAHLLAAEIELARGRPDEAARHAGEGGHLAQVSGFWLARTRFDLIVARSAIARGDSNAAWLARSALEGAVDDDAWGRADALHWVGVAYLKKGEGSAARSSLEGALALRARLRHPEVEATRALLAGLS
ncbi:helix-turn-helix domain-containing protein [Polyangium aurulentum]|uniref:helix-turn-helix domain-containing protein n=1 Tax=Polyangium aurulentum TaxID=2567896 RepID=UPI00146F399C|nr:helix-turn-helix transcriptional regulator [Polyangium aurulentum]UQA60119.1 helix-turn-helix domain-containing protein [Polyangium aurulentum]